MVPGPTLQGHVMGRLLRPVDVAATVGHLLSDATTMMTGTIIDLHPEMVRINSRAIRAARIYARREPIHARIVNCMLNARGRFLLAHKDKYFYW